jgi:signal peptidase II
LTLRLLAFGLAAATLAANLAAQPLLMHLPPAGVIPGLADFHPIWNGGGSFGLFAQDSDNGRYLLMAALAMLSAGVAVAAWRWSASRFLAAAYGLVLGGALGNLADRARFHGAVFDFLSLHLGSQPLFVCNFPDIAISAGAVLFLAGEVIRDKRARATETVG